MVYRAITMTSVSSEDALAKAVQALRDIYAGASAVGRWYCQIDHKSVGHNPSEPDAGYYDEDIPPAGYDAEGWAGVDDDDEEPPELLKPCNWEAYTLEEQSCWLETCADTARDALEKIGVPLSNLIG
jgi:hypothetical protein